MKKYLVIALGCILFSACGSNEDEDHTEKEEIQEVTVKEEEPSYAYQERLPSALQIAMLFKDAGMPFEEEALLGAPKVSPVTEFDKLLWIGAYASDLTYASLNKEEEIAVERMKRIVELSEDVGFASNLNTPENLQRFHESINNLEKLAEFIAQFEYELEDQIRKSGDESRAAIIFAGAWIHTLEIGRQTLASDPKEDVVFLLLEQQDIASELSHILRNLSLYPKPDKLEELVGDVGTLSTELNKFDIRAETVEISRNDFEALMDLVNTIHNKYYPQ